VTGWIWRRAGWSWGGLDRVSPASCVKAASSQGWLVLLSALGGAVGGWFLTQSNKLYGPEFTAFLGNLMSVFLVLFGLLSGERLRFGETVAIVVTISGAFVFSYQHGQVNWAGVGLMVLGCVLMAVKKTLMKHATGAGHLPSVMSLSLLFTGTWALAGAISSGGLHFGTLGSVGLSVAGGVSGAMIGTSLLYAGFKRRRPGPRCADRFTPPPGGPCDRHDRRRRAAGADAVGGKCHGDIGLDCAGKDGKREGQGCRDCAARSRLRSPAAVKLC